MLKKNLPTGIWKERKPGVQVISLIAEEKALLQNNDLQTIVYLKGVDENYHQVCGVAEKTFVGKFNIGDVNEPGLILGAGIQNAAGVNVSNNSSAPELTIILPKKGKVSVTVITVIGVWLVVGKSKEVRK